MPLCPRCACMWVRPCMGRGVALKRCRVRPTARTMYRRPEQNVIEASRTRNQVWGGGWPRVLARGCMAHARGSSQLDAATAEVHTAKAIGD